MLPSVYRQFGCGAVQNKKKSNNNDLSPPIMTLPAYLVKDTAIGPGAPLVESAWDGEGGSGSEQSQVEMKWTRLGICLIFSYEYKLKWRE